MTEDDPGDCVHDLFAHTMFGDTPLGRPVLGTVDTVNALTADRIRRFYKKHYDPTHLVVAAAGNIDHAKVVRQVRARLREGRRPDAHATPRPIAPARRHAAPCAPPAASSCSTARPSRPTSSSACRAWPAPTSAAGPSACSTPPSAAACRSRLFQEVREKRGLAYSVYSYTSGFADCGLFGVYAGCRPEPGPRRAEDLPRRARPGRRPTASPTRRSAAPSASSPAPPSWAWRTPAR